MMSSGKKQIALYIDPTQSRRFHQELALRLSRAFSVDIHLQPGRASTSIPTCLDLLLTLERLIHHFSGPRLTDKIDIEESQLDRPLPAAPDLIIDLCCGTETE